MARYVVCLSYSFSFSLVHTYCYILPVVTRLAADDILIYMREYIFGNILPVEEFGKHLLPFLGVVPLDYVDHTNLVLG